MGAATALSFHTPNNMADEDLQLKPRKSVAFADGQTIVDGDGQVTSSNMTEAGEKDSAESHGKSEGDQAVDEVTQMFEGLAKKKKSKKPKKTDDGEEGGEDKVADDGEVDLSALKKKKRRRRRAQRTTLRPSWPRRAPPV